MQLQRTHISYSDIDILLKVTIGIVVQRVTVNATIVRSIPSQGNKFFFSPKKRQSAALGSATQHTVSRHFLANSAKIERKPVYNVKLK